MARNYHDNFFPKMQNRSVANVNSFVDLTKKENHKLHRCAIKDFNSPIEENRANEPLKPKTYGFCLVKKNLKNINKTMTIKQQADNRITKSIFGHKSSLYPYDPA